MDINSYLNNVKESFQKKFKDSNVRFNFASQEPPPHGLPVDNPGLEFVLSRRFFSYGRCYLVYGKKGCSKTTFLLDMFKLYQQHGGVAIWIETESAADFDYAKAQGVDVDKLVYHNPRTLEEGLNLAMHYAENTSTEDTLPIIIGFDSIAGTMTEYEDDQDTIGQVKMGEHAKIMAGFYRQFCAEITNKPIIFVALNQLKERMSSMPQSAEQAETMLGGEAPRFHSTVQLRMQKVKELMGPDENGIERKVGSQHTITAVRNKLGLEGKDQKMTFDAYRVGGIDWYSEPIRFVAERYPHIISGSAWMKWHTEGITYVDDDGAVKTIDTQQNYRPIDMARMVKNSTPAKEVLRKAFLVHDMPSQDEMVVIASSKKAAAAEKKGRKKL